MTTNKIVIEVTWQPTDRMQHAELLADELSRAVVEALVEQEIEGTAHAFVAEK